MTSLIELVNCSAINSVQQANTTWNSLLIAYPNATNTTETGKLLLISLKNTLMACDGFCALPYGSGNSDIAGIGALITYLIFIGIGLGFVPLYLLLLTLLKSRRQSKLANTFYLHLEAAKVALGSLLEASVLFVISLQTACLIWRRNAGAQLFQQTFITNLSTLLSSTLIIECGAFKHILGRKNYILILAIVPVTLSAMTSGSSIFIDEHPLTFYDTMGSECHASGVLRSVDSIWPLAQLVGNILIFLNYPIALYAPVNMFTVCSLPVILFSSTALLIPSLYYLLQVRADFLLSMQRWGVDVDINEWGFGQVLAMFTWATVFFNLVVQIGLKVDEEQLRQQSMAEGVSPSRPASVYEAVDISVPEEVVATTDTTLGTRRTSSRNEETNAFILEDIERNVPVNRKTF